MGEIHPISMILRYWLYHDQLGYADMLFYFLEQKIWYNHYIRQKELLQLQD